jgi:hypothetical protein
VQEGTRPRFELWSPKAPALIDTQSQPILGLLPGIHLWRREPPFRWGSPISRAQLPAVRRLIPSSWLMFMYDAPAKKRSQNNCRIASAFISTVVIAGRLAAIVALKIAAVEFLCKGSGRQRP